MEIKIKFRAPKKQTCRLQKELELRVKADLKVCNAISRDSIAGWSLLKRLKREASKRLIRDLEKASAQGFLDLY